MGQRGCYNCYTRSNKWETTSPDISLGGHSMPSDSYFAKLLVGGQISSVLVDSEVTYIMLTNGTQITIKGLVAVSRSPVCRR